MSLLHSLWKIPGAHHLAYVYRYVVTKHLAGTTLQTERIYIIVCVLRPGRSPCLEGYNRTGQLSSWQPGSREVCTGSEQRNIQPLWFHFSFNVPPLPNTFLPTMSSHYGSLKGLTYSLGQGHGDLVLLKRPSKTHPKVCIPILWY